MPYSDTELAALLRQVKTIAVVGASDKPGRPVDGVGRYLLAAGFRILPVHPKRASVWGIPAFPNLADITEPVDLVDVFRAPAACPEHAREVLRMKIRPRCFWMQSGITSPAAESLLMEAGVMVVSDRCLMVEHQRLLGAEHVG